MGVWPITDLVIFDCDSTLSTVEGIDELARLTGQEAAVADLTRRAMDGEIPLESVYGFRLNTSNPNLSQVNHLWRIYRETVIPDAPDVIAALQAGGCKVFIVSGGLIDPVRDFGVWLNVPREHIFAVDMEYDQLAGEWWRYWEQPGGNNPNANYLAVGEQPLAGAGGKNVVIDRIRSRHPGRAMLVGDGLSDLEAADRVDLYVGFGGAARRAVVEEKAPVFIRTLTLSPILPLALGALADRSRWRALFRDGVQRIERRDVRFRDEAQREMLLQSLASGARR
ncbi:MAG: HAD-IB family phosphatase [Anaerolineales bacterium]